MPLLLIAAALAATAAVAAAPANRGTDAHDAHRHHAEPQRQLGRHSRLNGVLQTTTDPPLPVDRQEVLVQFARYAGGPRQDAATVTNAAAPYSHCAYTYSWKASRNYYWLMSCAGVPDVRAHCRFRPSHQAQAAPRQARVPGIHQCQEEVHRVRIAEAEVPVWLTRDRIVAGGRAQLTAAVHVAAPGTVRVHSRIPGRSWTILRKVAWATGNWDRRVSLGLSPSLTHDYVVEFEYRGATVQLAPITLIVVEPKLVTAQSRYTLSATCSGSPGRSLRGWRESESSCARPRRRLATGPPAAFGRPAGRPHLDEPDAREAEG